MTGTSLETHTARATASGVPGVELLAPQVADGALVLTPDALAFVARLARVFEDRRRELLAARTARQRRILDGERPDFLPETRDIRERDWTVAPIPADLVDRRVEITGPVDRKMIINALNSGAQRLHGRFRGLATRRRGQNTLEGQVNLRDAVQRHDQLHSPEGKPYALERDDSRR